MAGKRSRSRPRKRPTGEAQAIAVRRREVFDLLRSGMRQVRIAERLGVSTATVCLDVKHVMQELRSEAIEDAKGHQALVRARLESMYHAHEAAALAGDAEAARVCMGLIDRYVKLYGLDAPQRHEVTGSDGQPLVAVQAIQALVQRVEGAAYGAPRGD